MKLKKYKTASETSRALIERTLDLMQENKKENFHIALSGGGTPALLFDIWANEYRSKTDWERICFYWVDERCVAPEDSDSNYGMTKKLLLSKVPLVKSQIFRIRGEDDPEEEAKRYTELTLNNMTVSNGFPVFDLVMLGAGDDGHTSSIFPGQEELLTTKQPFAACHNPYNGQNRIAMTGQTIIAAKVVAFLITGENKADVVADIYSSGDTGPAAYVAHHSSHVELYVDNEAASAIK